VVGRENPDYVGGYRRESGFFVSVRLAVPQWRAGRGSLMAGRCLLPVFSPPFGLPPSVRSGWQNRSASRRHLHATSCLAPLPRPVLCRFRFHSSRSQGTCHTVGRKRLTCSDSTRCSRVCRYEDWRCIVIQSVFMICVDSGNKVGLAYESIFTSRESAVRSMEKMQKGIVQDLCIAEFKLNEFIGRKIEINSK